MKKHKWKFHSDVNMNICVKCGIGKQNKWYIDLTALFGYLINRKMKTIKWNIGIMVIWLGYRIRRKLWKAGVPIVKIGYSIRGKIPQKTWRYLSVPIIYMEMEPCLKNRRNNYDK